MGLVHAEVPPIELGAIHLRDGRVGVGGVVIGDETKTTRTTRLAIGDDLRLGDWAELFESCAETFVFGPPAQSTNKQLLRHAVSHCSCVLRRRLQTQYITIPSDRSSTAFGSKTT